MTPRPTPPLADSLVHWQEADHARSALWRSEAHQAPPKRLITADDTLSADAAYKLICEGATLLWRGDFNNARQMLLALTRRVDRKPPKTSPEAKEAFHLHRKYQGQRAQILSRLVLPLNADYSIPLRRAPDVRQACKEAYGAETVDSVVSMREMLGVIGAHEWRKNGVEIAALLGARIYPHYGVYSPVRGEYIQLVAEAPLPSVQVAFDIGTGSGVLAAVLAKRGVNRIVATDQDPRALNCARDNLQRLKLTQKVELQQANLFPEGQADLVVCNPPWVPAKPNSAIEHAVYDPDSAMLRGFLSGLAAHLTAKGEGWLILSDLAERLELRSRDTLLGWIADAGLVVIERHDTRPTHKKSQEIVDALSAARRAEVTSLWRLARA